MPSEFDTSERAEEPKDRTKWWWLLVVVLVLAAVGAMWWTARPDHSVSLVRAKHILIQCSQADPDDRARGLQTITELRNRILAGESFAKLAKDYSDDPQSAARGGDLGYYKKGSFEEAFEEFVWNAPLNQLSDIVRTGHGFHLIVVTDRTLSPTDAYDQELKHKAVQELEADPGAAM